MCQPKSKGGRRCLVHSSLSKFFVRNISVKTGASEELVKNTLSELGKEGKKLDSPTVGEVEQFIDAKRFKTEIDPSLNSHERKIELAQLDRAKEEAKAGVSGGAWHAWKNVQKRVVNKLKAMKKAVAAVAIAGALVFSLAGCGGAINNNNTSSPNPSASNSASANPSSSPTSSPVAEPAGDVVIKKDASGNPVVVTDEYGSYTPTTINPNDDSLTVNPATVDPKVAAAGWTAEDVASGQKYIATFVAEQTNDSIALDHNTGWDKWKNGESGNYLAPEWKDDILNIAPEGADRSLIVSNNSENIAPDLARDGGSRVSESNIAVTGVSNAVVNNQNMLVYSGTSETTYRAVEGNPFIAKSTWKYSVVKSGDSWLITGYYNTFDYFR